MLVYYWTSVSLRRLYIDQFPSIHFKDWDEVFVSKNTGKAFIHMTEIYCLVTISYEVFKRLQAFLFFPFVGYQSGNRKKTHFALLGSRSEHRFPACSPVPPKHINSREIGKTCQQKWNFQHQNHDDHDFLITYENETSSTTRLIILVFLNALEHQSNSSRNLPR